MQKVLTLRVSFKDDGTVAGLERVTRAEDRLEKESDEAARATRRLSNEQQRGVSVAHSAAGAFGRVAAVLGGIVGAGTLGILARDAFTYNQELEGTTISIAGLLTANRTYIGAQDQMAAAMLESKDLLRQIQIESLKTAATVPQLGDAFATTFGVATAAGIRATSSEILQMTVRLTQAGNAFRVPMEQMRQEINSLLSGQITQDSLIAKRLGFDNASVKAMVANGTMVGEIIKRTEAYAKAAEMQSNLLTGKFLNTKEVIVATIAKGLEPIGQKLIGVLDGVFGWFQKNGDSVVNFIRRVIGGFELVAARTGEWVRENEKLIKSIGSTLLIAGGVAGAVALVAGAIALIVSPTTWAIAAIVGLGQAWQTLSELPDFAPRVHTALATYRADFRTVTTAVSALWGAHAAALREGAVIVVSAFRLVGSVFSMAGGIIEAVTHPFAAGLVAMIKFYQGLGRGAVEVGRALSPVLDIVGGVFTGVVKSIAGAVKMIAVVLSPLKMIFGGMVGAAAAPVMQVGGIFGKLLEVVTTPIRKLGELVANLPAKIVEIVPGAEKVRDAARDLFKAFGDFSPAQDLGRAIAEIRTVAAQGNAEIRAAMNDKTPIPGPTDLVANAWNSARKYLDDLLPQLEKTGREALAKLIPSVAKGGGPAAGDNSAAAAKAQAKLLDLLGDYSNFMNDYRNGAAAVDPLEAELAQIMSKREDAIRKFEELQEKLRKALGVKFDAGQAKEDLDAINGVFDKRTFETISKSLEDINKRTLASSRSRFEQETDFALEEQRRQNEARFQLIDSASDREVAMRLAAIEEWFAAEFGAIQRSVEIEEERQRMLENLWTEKERREQFAREEVTRTQREQLVGTREWARKMAREIGTIPEQVTRAIGESRLEIAGLFDGVIDDLINNQADFGKSFNELTKNLASTWGKLLSDMLTKTVVNGESIVSQLKGVWSQLGGNSNPMTGGWGDLFDVGMAGAGVGSMVGSIVGGPNNFGAEGGMIGGAAGAAIGYYLAGSAGAKIGVMIGTAIGSAIGSIIQKGEDYIRVSIRNNVVSVTEKGIDAQTRQDVEIQVQRRLNEQMKSWRSILDMFPEHVRKMLAEKFKPQIGLLFDGVENGDISDAGALNALGDFLGNTLPKEAFNAYKTSIDAALKAMGVESSKITALFKYWGTLQGKELQDAVRGFVVAMMGGIEMRDKMSAPFSQRIEEARRLAGMDSLGAMGAVKNQMGTVVASATALTDIEDVIASQEQVNALARQYYDMGIARLQRIDAIEENILSTNANIREQIDLAAMDDQGKIDYYYQRLGDLRSTLTHATDPEEIARLTSEMQKYIQQAFGLAPGSEENREKLREILGDMDTLAGDQLQKAREAQAAQEKEVLELQRKQLEALIGIQQALGGPGTGTTPGGPSAGGGDGSGGPDTEEPTPMRDDQYDSEFLQQLLERLRGTGAANPDAATTYTRETDQREEAMARAAAQASRENISRTIADEMARALGSVQIRGSFDEPLFIDNGDLGAQIEHRVTRNVVLTFANNPDIARQRN